MIPVWVGERPLELQVLSPGLQDIGGKEVGSNRKRPSPSPVFSFSCPILLSHSLSPLPLLVFTPGNAERAQSNGIHETQSRV